MVRSGVTSNNSNNETTFQPFRNATTETPLCHMILEPTCLTSLQPLLVQLYRCRWFLSQPLRINLIPKWIKMKWMNRSTVTIGEILLVLPIFVCGIQGYYHSFVSPNTQSSGYFASYVIFLTFVTANKANSVFSLVFGIPFERMIPFHNLASLVSLVLTAFHIYTSFRFTDDSKFANVNILAFLVDGWTNQSGFIATLAMTILVLSSGLRIVRKFAYQLWLLLHITAAVAVLVGLILHKVGTAVVIALWWALDLVVRYMVQASCTYRTKCKLKLIDNAESYEPSVEISIDHPTLPYTAGQFVRIAIPAISILEFHPFSISSAPHEGKMTLHIRNLGDWTDKLVQLAATTSTTTVLMEGPYGAPSIDYDNDRHYQWFLLIGGGIGITPCQSIGKNILHQAQHQGRTVHGLRYVWAVRDMSLVEDIPPLGLTQRSDIAEVDIYCTRTTAEDAVLDSSVLPYNVHMGRRPDLNAIFTDMKAQASKLGESSVAVIACGPTKLMQDVENLCRQHSPTVVGCGGDGVFFDLHKEHFEF